MSNKIKICTTCKKILPLSSFYKDLRKTDNLTCDCKECRKERRKKYRASGVNRKREWSINTIAKHRERGYNIEITPTELTEIANETTHCKWCGRELHWGVGKGFISTNPTLDREDCEPDITIENVAIICHSCNVSKGAQTANEFRQYIKNMYEMTFYGSKNEN